MIAITPRHLLRGLGVSALVIAWACLAHATSASDHASDLELAVAFAPLLVVVVLVVWRIKPRWWLFAGGAALLALLAAHWETLRHSAGFLYYLQHAGSNLVLAVLFGRSLAGPGESLVTRFARFAHHGVLSPAQSRYTRQVTIAWTAFFATNAVLSTALYLFAATTVWSIFANLLAMPLVGLMFAAEFLVRHRVLPPADRTSVADTVRGYRESLSRSRSPASER